MQPKVFISYNPGVEIEQSTALRLQTISSLYNAQVFLPDRLGSTSLKDSTKQRILEAQVFVLFSTFGISSHVKQEAEFALANFKKVVIFYNKHHGKEITVKNAAPNSLIQIPFDPATDNPITLMKHVFDHGGFILHSNSPPAQVKQEKQEDNALTALVGVGLGLFLLWAITSDDKPKKNNRRG
jgi:hypothetical protein